MCALARALALPFPLSFHGIIASKSRSISTISEKQVSSLNADFYAIKVLFTKIAWSDKKQVHSNLVYIKKAEFACFDSKIAVSKFLTGNRI